MKVCTDSCILGAYTPVAGTNRILDIGTGTGLLSLMVAQRSAAFIEAVEIDEAAASQARQNIQASPWANRIAVQHQSLQQLATQHPHPYDRIICNPPFYTASHQSPSKARNLAMHSQELSFPEIVDFCSQFLSATGKLFILLPPAESLTFKGVAASANLHLTSSLKIFTTTTGKHIRTIQGFSPETTPPGPEEKLFIRNPDNSYTPAFRELLKDYYLQF